MKFLTKTAASMILLSLVKLGWAGPIDDARDAVADYRYSVAYRLFNEAADGGNTLAQRIAGTMAWYGETLYGGEVRRDRARATQLFSRAAAQGCEISNFYLKRMAAGDTPLVVASFE